MTESDIELDNFLVKYNADQAEMAQADQTIDQEVGTMHVMEAAAVQEPFNEFQAIMEWINSDENLNLINFISDGDFQGM